MGISLAGIGNLTQVMDIGNIVGAGGIFDTNKDPNVEPFGFQFRAQIPFRNPGSIHTKFSNWIDDLLYVYEYDFPSINQREHGIIIPSRTPGSIYNLKLNQVWDTSTNTTKGAALFLENTETGIIMLDNNTLNIFSFDNSDTGYISGTKTRVKSQYFIISSDRTDIFGNIQPGQDGVYDLGSPLLKFNNIYANNIVGNINADTVDGFHASSTPTANSLLALDVNAQFPSSVIAPFSNNLDANNYTIQNLSDPVNPQDAATKNYVDANATGRPDYSNFIRSTASSISYSGSGYFVSAEIITKAHPTPGNADNAYCNVGIDGIYGANDRTRIANYELVTVGGAPLIACVRAGLMRFNSSLSITMWASTSYNNPRRYKSFYYVD